MAVELRDSPELRPFVLSNVTLTGTRIGAGAYGSVEEVGIPGAICAAKKIHDVFQDISIPQEEIDKVSTQFVRECQLMSTLRHPNIVQFLGVFFFEGSRLPALVMERLLTDLHNLLDPLPSIDGPKPFFPLSLKCSILYNVASGLAFLHERTPPIIHRDLSARNVLLTSGMVAKIADLGVARIVPRMRAAATLTTAPGAGIYMPPEALEIMPEEGEDHSKYDVSIDIFSFGVVAIFTLSQTFPCNLLAPTYRNEQKQIVGRSELGRRDMYMQMIYSQLREDHPLLQMISRCLDFPEDRPNIGEVLGLLEEARGEEKDDEMEMNKLELIRTLHTQSRNKEFAELQQQLTVTKAELTRKEAELTRAEETIRRMEQLIEEMRQQSSPQAAHAGPENVPHSIPPSKQGKLSLQIYRKKSAPCIMDNYSRGSSTTDHLYAYFAMWGGSTAIYKYEWSTTKWEQLPSSPHHDPGLVIIDGELTAVGGQDGSHHLTNKLITLRQGQWVEHYPPMNTARYQTTIVSTSDGNYIVVIGGCGDRNATTIELFHKTTRNWYELVYLPPPLQCLSATICGNQLYLIGTYKVGYSCSIEHLLPSSDQPITSQSVSCNVEWPQLPQLPVTNTTAATLSGQLVIIGGQQPYQSSVNSIHQLIDGQWVKIGSMSIGRSRCLVVSPSLDKMMIVGGHYGSTSLDSVEECVVVY